jgi:hypothetical protein
MNSERQRRECEFQLLRYVPDMVRNEYVHIGVILREAASEEQPARSPDRTPDRTEDRTPDRPGGRVEVRFTHDWRRVKCLDPDADTALLEGMESELRRRLADPPLAHESGGRLMRILEESLSLNVQMTEPKAYLAESVPAGMEELMRLYVEPPARERVSRLSGRAAIHAHMRSEFERAGVWDLLRKRIAAAEYTRPGDPLRIDMGYRPNGLVRMFHAVSLDPRIDPRIDPRAGAKVATGATAGLEMAKVLAFSAAALRAGVARVEKAELELTAVIEPAARLGATDDEPERLAMYRFGVETMEEHQIRVLTTSDMERVAQTARRELRV